MRSSDLRRVGCSRSISRNPVILPMVHLGRAHQRRRIGWRTVSSFSARNVEHALVFMREDLDEIGLRDGEVFEDPRGARAAGGIAMALEKAAHNGDVFVEDERLKIDHGLVAAARGEVADVVVYVGDATAHAGGEVAAGGPDDDDEAVGHVLASVVADALDDGGGSGIADREALAGYAVQEGFAACCAIKGDVADEDAFFRQEARGLGRVGDDAPAGEALAEVVVGVAFELQRNARGNERAEALPGRAGELVVNGTIWQSSRPVTARDFAAQHGADSAMHVADGEAAGDVLL